jgi:hypothetical protein
MLTLALPELAKAASGAPFRSPYVSDCTKSCHLPVDCLHLIENKPDRLAIFSLTQNLKGVQQDRSLTVSQVFPVGAESGAQAQSLSHCKMRREGK